MYPFSGDKSKISISFHVWCIQETVLNSQTRNGEMVRITVTLTNELPPSSPVCLHFYNILFKRFALFFFFFFLVIHSATQIHKPQAKSVKISYNIYFIFIFTVCDYFFWKCVLQSILGLPNLMVWLVFIRCRILRILNMQQIGRNYYSPSDPLNIPQHKYILLIRFFFWMFCFFFFKI